MNVDNLTTIKFLSDFLQGNQAIAFRIPGNKSERYLSTNEDHQNSMREVMQEKGSS